ncbi:MAG: acetylesterase, partial [Lachnospiraceae bacterium]|nr:acetylesterase [Lachnospiraceae bacterium]
MALLKCEYYSNALSGRGEFYISLPNDVPPFMNETNPNYKRPMKTLVLLHGYSGLASDWVTGS